jgi:hypothetical protein
MCLAGATRRPSSRRRVRRDAVLADGTLCTPQSPTVPRRTDAATCPIRATGMR